MEAIQSLRESPGGKLRVAPLVTGGGLYNRQFKKLPPEKELALFVKLAKQAGFSVNGPHKLPDGSYCAELGKPK